MATDIPPRVDLAADRGPEIIQSTAAVATLATLIVIGRSIARKIQKAKWNASDYTIVLGLVGCWGMTAAVIASVYYGLGRHVQVVPMKDITKILQVTFASEIIYSFTFPIVKVSILLLYRSLFPGRRFAIVSNIVGLFVIAWGIALLLVSIFSCKPVNGFWDLSIPSDCINTRHFFIGNSVPNICTDVFILALPLSKVWHLQMSLKSKVLVSGLFLLGGFVCIITCVRFYFLLSLDQADISWSYYGVAVWSVVEVNVAVISACLPTMRPLFQKIGYTFRSLASSANGSEKWSWSWSWGRGLSKNTDSALHNSSQSEGKAFERIPEYPLGHMSAEKSTGARVVKTETRYLDLESGNSYLRGC